MLLSPSGTVVFNTKKCFARYAYGRFCKKCAEYDDVGIKSLRSTKGHKAAFECMI